MLCYVLARAYQAVSGGPSNPQDEVVFERLLSVERNEFGLGNGNGGYRRSAVTQLSRGERLFLPEAATPSRHMGAEFAPDLRTG